MGNLQNIDNCPNHPESSLIEEKIGMSDGVIHYMYDCGCIIEKSCGKRSSINEIMVGSIVKYQNSLWRVDDLDPEPCGIQATLISTEGERKAWLESLEYIGKDTISGLSEKKGRSTYFPHIPGSTSNVEPTRRQKIKTSFSRNYNHYDRYDRYDRYNPWKDYNENEEEVIVEKEKENSISTGSLIQEEVNRLKKIEKTNNVINDKPITTQNPSQISNTEDQPIIPKRRGDW